jgi:hypothetical protein
VVKSANPTREGGLYDALQERTVGEDGLGVAVQEEFEKKTNSETTQDITL